MINNKRNRWRVFLLAAANGTLLSRPNYVAPWRPHKYYQKPIWGRLQSSYEDMREEVKTIRDNRSGQWYVFLVGDGLTLMRLNHLLKASPDVYLDSTPTCIPVQGEHPHGLFHAMHCCLRLYSPFLRKLAEDVLENPSIKMEPNVSDFNVHRFFFLNMVTRAASEYLVELSRTPGADDLDDPIFILAKADANINLSWLTHFLYDAGFFILDFLQLFAATKVAILICYGVNSLATRTRTQRTRRNMCPWPSCGCFGAWPSCPNWMSCTITMCTRDVSTNGSRRRCNKIGT